MKNISSRLIAVLFSVTVFLSSLGFSAFANSAVAYFSGAQAISPILIDRDTALEVEKELLTFDIESFPKSYYEYLEMPENYGSTVTAEYTIYNPTDEDITARLLFPFGSAPDYLDEEAVYELITEDKRFGISLNGERIEADLRHSYSEYAYYDFDIEREISALCDGYIDDGFYSLDLTVTKYTYQVKEVALRWDELAEATFVLNEKDGQRVFYLPTQSGYYLNSDGSADIDVWVEEKGEKIEVFVFGKPLETPIKWKFSSGGKEYKINGRMELVNTETTTFEEFALKDWSADSGVSQVDWYNAVVTEAKTDAPEYEQPIVDLASYTCSMQADMMQWYDYKITVPAGERVVNAVCAPIFPYIDENYAPPIYEYTYLLSPAKTWKDFGELEVVINTPYIMIGDSSKEFSVIENGYSKVYSGLPEGELSFTMCTSPFPEKTEFYMSDIFTFESIMTILAVILGIGLLTAGILTAVILRKKHNSQKSKHNVGRDVPDAP